MITDEQLQELKTIFVKYEVVLGYLFGSQAEGVARPSSDVDIAVLLPASTPRKQYFDARLSLTNELISVFHKNDIDVVVLNEASPLLAYQVVKHGRIIYEDQVTRPAIDFTVYTLARYSDAKPARELARRYLEEWINVQRRARDKTPPQAYHW